MNACTSSSQFCTRCVEISRSSRTKSFATAPSSPPYGVYPPEILHHIIQLTKDDDDCSPQDLARVCKWRVWREAAQTDYAKLELGAPGTWTYDEVQSRFRLAGGRPKSLTLTGESCACPFYEEEDCSWDDVEFFYMLSETPFLERLSIYILTSPSCFNTLTRALGNSPQAWNLLDSLKLSFAGLPCAWYNEDKCHFDIRRLPPRIRSLELELTDRYGRGPRQIDTPKSTLSNLRSLSTVCPVNRSCPMSTLKHCVKLESLRLSYAHNAMEGATALRQRRDDMNSEAIALPNLQRLELCPASFSEVIPGLSSLVLPALKTLKMWMYDNLEGEEAQVFWEGLRNLRIIAAEGAPPVAALHSFILSCGGRQTSRTIPADMFADLLLSLPSLGRLVLDGIRFDAARFSTYIRKLLEDLDSGGVQAGEGFLRSL